MSFFFYAFMGKQIIEKYCPCKVCDKLHVLSYTLFLISTVSQTRAINGATPPSFYYYILSPVETALHYFMNHVPAFTLEPQQ